MKKSSAASGLAQRVMTAVQQPKGNVSELPPIADAMDALMVDIERGRAHSESPS